MFTTSQTVPSTSNFTLIFDAALDEYKRLTGQDLRSHPFSVALDTCNSPDAVLNVFEKQAQAFGQFRKDGDKLMKWLTPTVHVLFTLSGTLGEGIGLPFSPAKAIFTGICVLLGAVKDIATSYETLANLFERIQFSLQRLNCYVGVPLTTEMTVLLGKIMAHTLSILARLSKTIKERRISKSFSFPYPFFSDHDKETFLKRLVGRRDIEDAVQYLDTLTKEEGLMTAARNLAVTHHIDGNLATIKDVIRDVDSNVKETKELTHQVEVKMKMVEGVAQDVHHNVKVTKDSTDEIRRNQSREKLLTWLSPPSPSVNHNIACDTHLNGTAMWFTRGSTFDEWKKNGSLLWIRGNPGSGKSVLCSTIIEDIKHAQEAKSALITYYYFDFKDLAKRDLRGLLSSLLMQLGDNSVDCWDILYRLYVKCCKGLDQPSEAALTQCLKDILEYPGQFPIYIILDALDECSNATGSPSPRKKVLDFVKDLVGCKQSNLYVCTTSRPEQDIQAALVPLTPTSHRVSLHEEVGQKEDINNYIRHFVHSNDAMRRWRAEDRELVINTLSERANGMFRWVYCQLDTLSRCFPPSIRQVLNELPVTLDDTYERTLQGIPKEKWQHAHRLFQCLGAALRPLSVEELAEIFTIKFDAGTMPTLVEDWLPINPEEAVLSACSTLISIDRKIVQFSHFSVKEFLTSDRVRTSEVASVRFFYIPIDAAHTILARACLTVLPRRDETTDMWHLSRFPLAFYAAQYWVDHTQFEGVAPRITDALKHLFDPKKTYITPWGRIFKVELMYKQTLNDFEGASWSPIQAAHLYYAAFCGFTEVAMDLIVTHRQDANAKTGFFGGPLHAASYMGHLETARQLLDFGADANSRGNGKVPLKLAYEGGHLEIMRLLLTRGADVNVLDTSNVWTLLHDASCDGQAEVVQLLLQHNADVDGRGYLNQTALHFASEMGHTEVARLLLENGADPYAKDRTSYTPFQVAKWRRRHRILELMLGYSKGRG